MKANCGKQAGKPRSTQPKMKLNKHTPARTLKLNCRRPNFYPEIRHFRAASSHPLCEEPSSQNSIAAIKNMQRFRKSLILFASLRRTIIHHNKNREIWGNLARCKHFLPAGPVILPDLLIIKGKTNQPLQHLAACCTPSSR